MCFSFPFPLSIKILFLYLIQSALRLRVAILSIYFKVYRTKNLTTEFFTLTISYRCFFICRRFLFGRLPKFGWRGRFAKSLGLNRSRGFKSLIFRVNILIERYRSGHNGVDLKSSVAVRSRPVGSNPTLSALFQRHQQQNEKIYTNDNGIILCKVE